MLVMDQNLEQHMSNEANVQIPKAKTREKNRTNATSAILHPHVQIIRGDI